MNISVSLYGPIARVAGGRHLATLNVELPSPAHVRDLLNQLNLDPEEVGLVFINAVLHDLPGLHLSLDEELHDQDHIGLFSAVHVWPYHYRGGAVMSPRLREYMATHDYLRHQPG
ncbi:MAG: MoaD/ThiS family protein [Chloroflexi bacterium]|nr:MoaD/ThiS family protein [Chloroflexota bacterium]